MTPRNIQAGFEVTGIWPFNPEIFQECDFAPAEVTDRPNPEDITERQQAHVHTCPLPPSENAADVNVDSTGTKEVSNDPASVDQPCSSSSTRFVPSELRPLPKAGPRKGTNKRSRKRKSEVLTDTPIRAKLAEEETRKSKNKAKKKLLYRKKGNNKLVKPKTTPGKKKKLEEKHRQLIFPAMKKMIVSALSAWRLTKTRSLVKSGQSAYIVNIGLMNYVRRADFHLFVFTASLTTTCNLTNHLIMPNGFLI